MARFKCPRCSNVAEGDPATLRCPRCGYPDPAPSWQPVAPTSAAAAPAPSFLPPLPPAPAHRPLGSLRSALMVLVPISILASLLFTLATRDDLAALRSLGPSPSPAEVEAMLPHLFALIGMALLLGAISLPAFIVKLVWAYRARRNVQGRQSGFTWAPGWAIGAWFIPLASAVLPYLVLRETERAAQAPPGSPAWHGAPASPLLPIVIGLEVAAAALGIVSGAFGAASGVTFSTQLAFLLPTAALSAAAQGLFLAFVQRLTVLQEGRPPAP